MINKLDFEKYKFDISLIVLTILFFIFRTSIPVFKYPFIVLYSFSLIYIPISYRKYVLQSIKIFLSSYSIVILLLLILILSFLLSKKIYLAVFKEIANSVILISLFFILTIVIREETIKFFNTRLTSLILFFAVVISLTYLLEVLDIFNYSTDYTFYRISSKPGSNPYIDYNFAILPVFFGIVISLKKLYTKRVVSEIIIHNFLIFLFTLSILFSASKRGLIVLLILIFFLFFINLPFLKKYNSEFVYMARNSRLYLILLLFAGIFIYSFIQLFSPSTKNIFLDKIGSNNISIAKKKLTVSLYRYSKMFDPGSSYEIMYKKLWYKNSEFERPEDSWESLSHKIINPLYGKNVEIIPDHLNKIGYLLDYTSFSDYYYESARAATPIFHKDVENEKVFYSSIYCFVSEDFDGDLVSFTGSGAAYGNTSCDYNLTRKGEWQKLQLYGKTFKGQADIDLIFLKGGISDFKNLKGYVIFSQPEFECKEFILDPSDPDTGWGTNYHQTVFPLTGPNVEIVPKGSKGYRLDSATNSSMIWQGACYSLTRPINSIPCKEGDIAVASVYCFVSENYDGSWVYAELANDEGRLLQRVEYVLYYRNTWQKIEISAPAQNENISLKLWFNKPGVLNFKSLKGYVIWAFPKVEIIKKIPDGSVSSLPQNHSNEDFFKREERSLGDNNLKPHSLSTQYKYASFFPLVNLPLMISQNADKDPVRNFVSKLISEDTTYYDFHTRLIADTVTHSFFADRLSRWSFALKIFSHEYSATQKIFGGGFEFLYWYGKVFLKDKTIVDYPHNQFLHILLYSGLFGLLIYMFLIVRVLLFYYKNFKQFPVFSVCFAIAFFFTFFSGGPPLEPPMMGLFILLPFFIDNIQRNKD